MTSGIIEILIEDAGVQALAGLNQAGSKYKVYPVIVPQGEKGSYITVFKISNDPVSALTKRVSAEIDYPRVSVNCWAKNFRQTELMAEAVRNALDNKSASTDAGYTFTRIWLVDDRDGYNQDTSEYMHNLVFAVELKRTGSELYDLLSSSGFVKWGGLWNWADNGNALPTDVQAGKMWITEGVYNGPPMIPDGTLMTAKTDDANSFSEFNFNL